MVDGGEPIAESDNSEKTPLVLFDVGDWEIKVMKSGHGVISFANLSSDELEYVERLSSRSS